MEDRKQSVSFKSSSGLEYQGMTNLMCELTWIKGLEELKFDHTSNFSNQAAIEPHPSLVVDKKPSKTHQVSSTH